MLSEPVIKKAAMVFRDALEQPEKKQMCQEGQRNGAQCHPQRQ